MPWPFPDLEDIKRQIARNRTPNPFRLPDFGQAARDTVADVGRSFIQGANAAARGDVGGVLANTAGVLTSPFGLIGHGLDEAARSDVPVVNRAAEGVQGAFGLPTAIVGAATLPFSEDARRAYSEAHKTLGGETPGPFDLPSVERGLNAAYGSEVAAGQQEGGLRGLTSTALQVAPFLTPFALKGVRAGGRAAEAAPDVRPFPRFEPPVTLADLQRSIDRSGELLRRTESDVPPEPVAPTESVAPSTIESVKRQIAESIARQRANPTSVEELGNRFPISGADAANQARRGTSYEPPADMVDPAVLADLQQSVDRASAQIRARETPVEQSRPLAPEPVAQAARPDRRVNIGAATYELRDDGRWWKVYPPVQQVRGYTMDEFAKLLPPGVAERVAGRVHRTLEGLPPEVEKPIVQPTSPRVTTDQTLMGDFADSIRAKGRPDLVVDETPAPHIFTKRAPSIKTNMDELRANAIRQRISGPTPTAAVAPDTALGARMLRNESGIVAAAARSESWVTPELLRKHYANEALARAAQSGDTAAARDALATLEGLGASASNTTSHLRTAGIDLPRTATFADIREALRTGDLADSIRARGGTVPEETGLSPRDQAVHDANRALADAVQRAASSNGATAAKAWSDAQQILDHIQLIGGDLKHSAAIVRQVTGLGPTAGELELKARSARRTGTGGPGAMSGEASFDQSSLDALIARANRVANARRPSTMAELIEAGAPRDKIIQARENFFARLRQTETPYRATQAREGEWEVRGPGKSEWPALTDAGPGRHVSTSEIELGDLFMKEGREWQVVDADHDGKLVARRTVGGEESRFPLGVQVLRVGDGDLPMLRDLPEGTVVDAPSAAGSGVVRLRYLGQGAGDVAYVQYIEGHPSGQSSVTWSHGETRVRPISAGKTQWHPEDAFTTKEAAQESAVIPRNEIARVRDLGPDAGRLRYQVELMPRHAAAEMILFRTGDASEATAKAAELNSQANSSRLRFGPGAAAKGEVPPTNLPGVPIGELAKRLETKGGFTYDPQTGGFPGKGFAVSAFKEREFVAPHDPAKAPDQIYDYISANSDILTQEGAHLGAWVEHGKLYLDVSIVSETAAQAEKIALAHGQKAYHDLAKGEDVYVGNAQDLHANPAQRLAAGEAPPGGAVRSAHPGGSGQEPRGPQAPLTPAPASGWDHFLSAWNLSKALKASFDLSAPFRQGILLAAGHPGEFFGAFKPMLQAAKDAKFAEALNVELLKTERPGLFIADISGKLSAREEAFISNFANRIPGMSASNRAYVTFLNKLRADVYDNVLAGWQKGGKAVADADRLGWANVINHFTGRGDLPGGISGATAFLNGAFFSPRLAISRIQSVGDALGVLKSPSSLAAREAAADLAKFVGAGLAVLTLARLAGYEVGGDPRSASFGKIQIGPTSVDIWGGEQQMARYGAQLLTEQAVTSSGKNAGKVETQPRDYTLGRLVRSKLAPTTGAANDILGIVGRGKFEGAARAKDSKENAGKTFGDQVIGRDFIGQPVTPKSLPGSLTAPLGWSDTVDAARQGSPLGALSLLGLGIQTINPTGSALPSGTPQPGPFRLTPPGAPSQTTAAPSRFRLTPPTGAPAPVAPSFRLQPPTGGGHLRSLGSDQGDVATTVQQTAQQNGIDPRLALATATIESDLEPNAVGDNGDSHGIFQENVNGRGAGRAPDYDPARQTARFAADVRRLLASGYRGSPGEIAAAVQRPADPQGYARKVDAIYSQL